MQNGFDHSYSILDHDRYFDPKSHTEDDKPLPAVKQDSGFYLTTFIADHAIKCLKEHQEKFADQPFFQYLAFTSPHFPLQAPAEDIAKYKDRYTAGWDQLRVERWNRMQTIGIGGSNLSAIERGLGPPYAFPKAIEQLGPNEINLPFAWDALTADQREFQSAKMPIHAAMVDRMDREIGRVLNQVKAMGAMDHTIIFFLSDNGASAEMMIRGNGHDAKLSPGSPGTFLSIGPGWSSMCNTPFRRHKTWVHEGGISTPLIAHWPAGISARGELRSTPGHVVDLLPTIMEVAGGKVPDTWNGESEPSRPGKSLVPQFSKDGTVIHDSLWWLHEGNRALRAGDWKIVAAGKDSPWELYDLSRDRGEMNDIAAVLPDKVKEMAEMWTRQEEQYFALARRNLPASQVSGKDVPKVEQD